jgi:hypothetical protein
MNVLMTKFPLYLIVTFSSLLVFQHAFAQIKLAQVAGNNINARINNSGVLFSDIANNWAAFEVPAGSNTHAFFSAALTMGGIDPNGALRTASAYSANSDYSSGPLKIGTALSSDSVRMNYNRIWEINRDQINQHRMSFSDPSYNAPIDLLEWPAHGDTSKGYDFYLAPFVDENQNGIYEPHHGDYPDVQGDFTFYFINNDATSHYYTNTLAIGAEIHCMVYGYTSPGALNEALFVDYRVINRSGITYNNFYIGQYVDPDLGNPGDDYLEADVNRGMVFVKNGDSFDDPAFGFNGYGNHPGAAGVLVLRGPHIDGNGLDDSCLSSPLYTPNGWGFEDEEIDNERLGLSYFMPINNTSNNNGLPDLAIQFYNYMRGIWKNGQVLSFGGNGYTSGGKQCRIAYFNDTDPSNYGSLGDSVATNWVEDNNNLPGNRLAMLASGPFTFSAQEELHVTYAFLFARDLTRSGVAASVDSLKSNADIIRDFYFNKNALFNCFNPLGIKKRNLQELTVFPVPANDYLTLKDITGKSHYSFFSINGNLLKEGSFYTKEATIDLSSFDNGIYFLQVQNSEGTSQTKVMIAR